MNCETLKIDHYYLKCVLTPKQILLLQGSALSATYFVYYFFFFSNNTIRQKKNEQYHTKLYKKML